MGRFIQATLLRITELVNGALYSSHTVKNVKKPASGQSGTVHCEQSLDLPLSVRHPRKARTVIPAPVDPLPTAIAPMSLATEVLITESLIVELNSLHCLNLSEKPEVKRDSGLPKTGLGGASWS